MNLRTVLVLALVIFLFFRLTKSWPLEKPKNQDPELENLAAGFIPAREFLAQNLDEVLPQPQAGLLSGILLGVKSTLPKDFSNALRRTSTIHIVVVSGQNLTLLIGFVMGFAPIFGRKKTIILSLFTIIGYSLLTGLQIPVLRAALMVGFSLIAQLFGREKESPWILYLTAILMLIYNPNWLLSISFQLSFLATFGVIVIAPQFVKKLTFLPSIIKEDLGVSLAAQALTWPVIAANFHQASIVGVLANAFVLWTVSIVMVSGIFTLIASLINPMLATLIALIPGALLTYFVYIIQFFNSLPYASIYISKTHILVWLGYYLSVLGLFLILKNSNKTNENQDLQIPKLNPEVST